ncbi:MAG: tryptophan synthase subunit alpha [Chloroflexota bacterium]|nr:tryptophan synthase subunit alpha [Chloroflexota bacterium]
MPTDPVAVKRHIDAAFSAASDGGRAALIPYVLAGYPDADGALAAALAAIDGGGDVLEIGLPYSDPLADGPTLQRASRVALASGANLENALELVAAVRAARPATPLVVMGYVNQFLRGRDGKSLGLMADAGAAGLIIADLTPDDGPEVEEMAVARGLDLVYLVAPTTASERIGRIAARSRGFLYAVSLVGVTGARRSLPAGVSTFLHRVRAVSPVPVAVGFGVSRPAHVRRLAPLADGIVVASALIDALGPDGHDTEGMGRLVEELAGATGRTP